MWQRFFLISGAVVMLGFCFSCGLLIGLVSGEAKSYQRRYEYERDLVAPLISSDPAFSRVSIEMLSSGGIECWGSVSSVAEKERLTAIIIRALGESRGRQVASCVEVKSTN
jgi:hypothetical protein